MKYVRFVPVALLTAGLILGSLSPAEAGVSMYSPLTAFGLEFRHGISARYQEASYAAERLSVEGGDVTPAYAHRATRIFLDSAASPQPSQEARDHYVLFAASSELIAASHESGAAADRSRRNAVALLTPLAGRYFEFFVVSYTGADSEDGAGAVVVSVRVDGPRDGYHPSPLATISSSLLGQAQAARAAAGMTS